VAVGSTVGVVDSAATLVWLTAVGSRVGCQPSGVAVEVGAGVAVSVGLIRLNCSLDQVGV